MTFYVYRVLFTGSMGSHQMGPLYATRPLAIEAMAAKKREWDEFERSGQGAIFGQMQVDCLEVVGTPALQAELLAGERIAREA